MWLVHPALAPNVPRMLRASCSHASHAERAYGRDAQGRGNALKSAAYPPEMNAEVVNGIILAHAASAEIMGVGEQLRWGASLPPDVRAAIAVARATTPRFASSARLVPVPLTERWMLPFPPEADVSAANMELAQMDWSTVTDSEGSDDETLEGLPDTAMRPARRAARVPDSPAVKIAYWMLWRGVPEAGGRRLGFEHARGFMAEAEVAMDALIEGRPPPKVETRVLLEHWKEPWARGRQWDCRQSGDCVIVRRSTRRTRVPGRQMDRAAFRTLADKLEWHAVDADILSQSGEGGVEARSSCEFVSVLAFHHKGLQADFEAADGVITAELGEGWIFGPFTETPPLEPIRLLPRNVVLQRKSRVLPDASVEEYTKPRVTTNASYGVTKGPAPVLSPNEGLTQGEKHLRLPTAQRHGHAATVTDAFGDGDGVRAGEYSIDGESAFRFLLDQRADWWMQSFVWKPKPGPARMGGGPWAKRNELASARRFGILIDTRPDFGGGHNPNRYQRTARVKRAEMARQIRAFDAQHPYPPDVDRVASRRAALQRAGLLPSEREQLEPWDIQVTALHRR